MPLLSAIISGSAGRKIGVKGVGILTSGCMGISLMVSCWIFWETILNSSVTYVKLWKWFDSGLLTAYLGLQFDSLTSIMLVVITCISLLVHIYSTGYMSGDPHMPRFMSYLSLFTFLMVVLVTSDNYVQLFIGWEGVGLCSYLLINYWFLRIKASQAAMKAMLINRVGDIALVLAIMGVIEEFGGLEYSTVDSVLSSACAYSMIGLLLFIGAVGKSAQLGLHTWLPDAMEGPTPVSALIHAATMVTAGVFLVIRSACFFEGSPLVLTIITLVGALTALFAATVGIVQNDLKRVIAYSTCSQLGYMVMICGLSSYSVSLFHLINHAFFKALLFLSAGSVIHAISDEQDMRRMGGLIKFLPFSYVMTLIGSLSLIGFPYLTGFYSKDLILELVYDKRGDALALEMPSHCMVFAYWLGCFSVLLTAFYSIRLIYLTFITDTNSKKDGFVKVHEAPPIGGVWPLLILALGSIFLGYFGKEFALSNIISPIIPDYVKMVPLILSLFGALMGFVVCDRALGLVEKVGTRDHGNIAVYYVVYTFLNAAWQFNYVVNHLVILHLLNFAHLVTYRVIDRGLLTAMGPKGITQILLSATQNISYYQSGMVFNYVLITTIFTALFFIGIMGYNV